MNNKILTDGELIDIVKRAKEYEIECADAYTHFLEDLGQLVTEHFGGNLLYVNGPVHEGEHNKFYRCDNCGKLYTLLETGNFLNDEEFTPLEECEDLFMRLDPGSIVPAGECKHCEERAFVYEERHIDDEWVIGIDKDESVPSDGGVYAKYDTDVDWEEKEQP
jgi:hypothetical protein